jgi:hypothetical protein
MALPEVASEVTDFRWAAVTLAVLVAGSATLAADLATDASADLDLASMDTRVGPTTITTMAPVRGSLLTAMLGLATDIQHRNLLRAAPATGAAPDPTLGRATKTAALHGRRRAFGNLWRGLLAFVGACPELSW